MLSPPHSFSLWCVVVCVCVYVGELQKKSLSWFLKNSCSAIFFFSTPFSCFSKVEFHFPFYSCKKEQEPCVCVCESCPVASIQIFMNLIFIMSWLRNPWKLALYLPCAVGIAKHCTGLSMQMTGVVKLKLCVCMCVYLHVACRGQS